MKITFLFLVGLFSCNAKRAAVRSEQPPVQQQSCEDVICTRMFATVGVEVRDAKGKPVQLDEAYTMVSETGQRVPMEQTGGSGHYTVLDDSYRKQLQNRSDKFKFIGMKNGAKVVEETYTISADCCHVKKEVGMEVIVVN